MRERYGLAIVRQGRKKLASVDDCYHCNQIPLRQIAVDDAVRSNNYFRIGAGRILGNRTAASRESFQPIRHVPDAPGGSRCVLW